MIYTAQCSFCKKVVAYSKNFSAVQAWLDQGLIVTKKDFTEDDPLLKYSCSHCGKENL